MISPPTLIPAQGARLALDHADRPVRASLGLAARVPAGAGMLADYDTREQFRAARVPAGNPARQRSSEDR